MFWFKKKVETKGIFCKAYQYDAGWDLTLAEKLSIWGKSLKQVDCEQVINIPKGYVGLILPRSSWTAKGLVCNTGVVDSGYTGTMKISFVNNTKEPIVIEKGSRVAQLVLIKLANLHLKNSYVWKKGTRGKQGFGSSGY